MLDNLFVSQMCLRLILLNLLSRHSILPELVWLGLIHLNLLSNFLIDISNFVKASVFEFRNQPRPLDHLLHSKYSHTMMLMSTHELAWSDYLWANILGVNEVEHVFVQYDHMSATETWVCVAILESERTLYSFGLRMAFPCFLCLFQFDFVTA